MDTDSTDAKLVESGIPFKTDMEKMKQKIDEDNRKISNQSVRAFFEQFPFLEKYANPARVKWVELIGIDEKFLKKYLSFTSNDSLFLNEVGEELTRTGVILAKNKWWQPRKTVNTLEDAIYYLEKIGKSKDIQFILIIHGGKPLMRKRWWSSPLSIEFYKPPRGFKVLDWVKELEKRNSGAEKLKRDLERIDSEAEK